MGYDTNYVGVLKFKNEVTPKELAKMGTIVGEDCRDHPEWDKDPECYTYIDLELTDDYEGLQYNGDEKSSGMVGNINTLLNEMRKEFPEFGLKGGFVCQGETILDRWKLKFKDGKAIRVDIVVDKSKLITCPHCEEQFELEGTE